MTTPNAVVYIHLEGADHFAGTLWVVPNRRGQAPATFHYSDAWMENPLRFALDLELEPATGSRFNKERLFGAVADSAPDRWGRTLMARAERHRAAEEGRRPRTLTEIDYVLGVSDITRQGALRFTLAEGGDFLERPGSDAVPPIVDLPRLLAAAEGFLDDPSNEEFLRILLAPGSSLGGARPKASVIDGAGQLYIAKFPKKDDPVSINAWEHITLGMARDAGIRTAESELIEIEGRKVILLPRFDREGEERIHFLSAMTMMDATDQERRSYLEVAEVIQRVGSSTREDLRELFRRIVFTVLVSNTDDHLRNHGFLYAGQGGWTLSPAYDINPTPDQGQTRFLSTAIGVDPEDTTASLDVAFEVAEYFDLDDDEARGIAAQVADVTRTWAQRATTAGIPTHELDAMRPSFEHQDLDIATGR